MQSIKSISPPPSSDGVAQPITSPTSQRAMSRHGHHARYLTLVHDDRETVRVMPDNFADAEALAREWARVRPDSNFHLRVPVEYASLQASRLVQGPYLWIANAETYDIAIAGVHGLRMEVITDAPLPPPESPRAASPPPDPVLEMPASFNLELNPGQVVGIDTICASDDLDMSRTEDGTIVDGNFFGMLKITHDGDDHSMAFSGTRLTDAIPPGYFIDARTMGRLIAADKPITAKCQLSILTVEQQYCDITLAFSPMWKLGVTWPPAEPLGDNKVKFFLRVHPGGALEHFDSEMVVTSIYYEAMPDLSNVEPASYISPANGFAMPLMEFIPHLCRMLDSLGLSIQARTQFVSNSVSAFGGHKNIAYRFMQPHRLSAAIDLSVTADRCVWTRIFLMWRGVLDDEMPNFAQAGEKAASAKDWKAVVGYSEGSKDPKNFRVLEISIMDLS